AQEEHMISGKTVPVDQVTEIQLKCDELRQDNTAAKTPGAVAPATPAAGMTPAPAGAAAPAGDQAAPAANAAPANAPTASTAGWTDDGSKIDLERLTVALCDEGNFVAPAQ
ncbi:MAG TPA: hypothetical protein VLZ53_01620, partial [Devosia sp.]|nr:hypothetical protein [Devosia sp.]